MKTTAVRQVEITLDTACVWSYLGYTRFERAAAHWRRDGGQVRVLFRPFQVDPDASPAGESLAERLRRDFGDNAGAQRERVAALGKEIGLDLRFDRALHTNTFESHRLIAQASRQGLAERMVERLFRAYYSDGLNVADPAVLTRLAAEIGVTTNTGGVAELRADLAEVRRGGVTGVPLFVFDGGPTRTGAQAEEFFRRALERAEPVSAGP